MTRAFNCDCMEAMREFPDGFFDLAVVDPPYGIGADNFKNGSGASKDAGQYGTAVRLKNLLNSGAGKLADRVLNKADCSWDAAPPPAAYFEELRRVSKNQIIWGGNYFDLPPTRGIIVWENLFSGDGRAQVWARLRTYGRRRTSGR